MKIGLLSHTIKNCNLGCSALAISNLKLMDEVFKKRDISVEYIVILPETGKKIDFESDTSLKGYTDYPFTCKTYPRPKNILKKPWILKTTDAFSGCDFVIDLCGGDGYTDNYGMKRLLAESIPIFGCQWNHVVSFFAPQTIGPFNTKLGKFVAKRTLKKLKVIFVRDQSSYDCCKSLGFAEKTLNVTDVAFALPYTKKEFNNGKMNIGINVSGLLYHGGYDHENYFNLSFSYREFIEKLLDQLCKKEEVQVHLIPHVIYEYDDVDDDYSVCVKLKKKYPEVILPPKFKTASEAKSYISGMDLFSGARMHSTIGATSSGVPVIPVAYSRKFNGLFNTLDYPYYIDAKSDMTVEQAIEKFVFYMDHMDSLREGVQRAEVIYRANLEKYQKLFAQIVGVDNFMEGQ